MIALARLALRVALFIEEHGALDRAYDRARSLRLDRLRVAIETLGERA